MSDVLFDATRWGRWPSWDLRLAQPPDGRAVAIAAAAGVAFDAGIRSGVASIGGILAVVVAAAGLVASGRLHTAASRTCVAGAVAIGAFLPLRMTPWLLPLDLLTVAGLTVLAAMLAREGSMRDLPMAALASRAVGGALHAAAAMTFLVDPPRRWLQRGDTALRQRGATSMLRGLLIALPLVVVLTVLLASADAIFASVVQIHVAVPGNAYAHAALVAIGALSFAALLRLASANPPAPIPPVPWRLGSIEWTVVLGSVVVLLGTFAAVQAVAIAGGGRHVLETEGLTYATYARSGYFQLLAVTVIVGTVLGGVSTLAARAGHAERRRFLVLAELTLAMTAIVLGVALRRLGLYESAYGWTMLRLMAKAGGVWIGILLVLLAVRLAGAARHRAWFLPAAVTSGVCVLLALNIADPEAAVARHNLERARHGREVDPSYLVHLSDDAVPTLVRGLADLPATERAAVVAGVCSEQGAGGGMLAWNLSAARADTARDTICG